jgi:hypothetical protein
MPPDDDDPVIDPWLGGCLIVTVIVTMSLLGLLHLL